MSNRKKPIGIILIVLTMLLLVSSTPPARAQFVLASWDNPDEYGQGIDGVRFYENSTSAWLAAPWYTHYYPDYHEELGTFYYLGYEQDNYFLNWSAGVCMKLRVYDWINMTLVGAETVEQGKNFLRNSVSVTLASEIVFSQQNFTFYSCGWIPEYGDIAVYQYEVILDFLPSTGGIYTLTITYEIFFEE